MSKDLDVVEPVRVDRVAIEEIKVGWWYWVSDVKHNPDTGAQSPYEWLGCVTEVGSNYAELTGAGSRQSTRVHFRVFDEKCRREPSPETHVREQVSYWRECSRELLGEVAALTARLCVSPRIRLAGGEETKAVALRGDGQSVEDYGKALAEAREKTLPELFREIRRANEHMAEWMTAEILPLKAQADLLKGAEDVIKERIHSVKLYAGLVEDVCEVRKGKPATLDDQVYLMQRRHYMDEECLLDYRIGGMEFKDIRAFDKWLSRKAAFERIFPFPRCIVAFRVRRNSKDRGEVHNLSQYLDFNALDQADKLTFLYVRNGDRLSRFSTEVEFGEKLFPDLEHRGVGFGVGKLWAKFFASSTSYEDIVTDEQYQGILEEEKKRERELRKIPKKDRWKHGSGFLESERYRPVTPEDVYFDDAVRVIGAEASRHNQLVLVLQGLLDRSSALHPHPPWQLWTSEGFAAGLRLVYDDSRALVAGDKPDFEAYRAKLNAGIAVGCVTVGQEDAWELHEGAKETARRMASWRYKRDESVVERCRPYGDPGPGTLAKVVRFARGARRCTYSWMRERRRSRSWRSAETDKLRAMFTCPDSVVLNVTAYRPGDYRQFYADPRTRAEYLKWAPFLLEAEEYHAGNRKHVFDDDREK